MKYLLTIVICFILYANSMGQEFYPTWESLKNQSIPKWYQEGQEFKNKSYTAQDVRYLIGPDDLKVPLYAIALDYPDNEFHFPAIKSDPNKSYKKVNEVRMLGYSGELEWTQSESGLKIKLPDNKPCDYAYCFEIK